MLLVDVRHHGGVLSGSDGALPGADQLLYLSWARESGESVLAADPFDRTGPHNVLAPVYLLSGLAAKTGLDLRVAVWLWKPAAAVLLVNRLRGLRARVPRGNAGAPRGARLAVFYFSPILPLLDWLGLISLFDRFEFLLISGERMLILWPLAAFAVYLAVGNGRFHAFQGMSLPGLNPGQARSLVAAIGPRTYSPTAATAWTCPPPWEYRRAASAARPSTPTPRTPPGQLPDRLGSQGRLMPKTDSIGV